MRQKKHIPTFKSIEEEAVFWDSHDTTDFEEEFKPVKVRFAMSGITVRFDVRTLNTLRASAAKKGIGATTLIRMWVLERLTQQKQSNKAV